MKKSKLKLRKGFFCIIYIKDKNKILYLLLKRKLHWKGWEFVKGGLEIKESYIQALKREIKEETGCNPYNIKLHPVNGKYFYNQVLKDRQNIIGQTYKLFSAELRSKRIRIDKKEHSNFKWMNYKEALSLLTWSNQRKCLKYVNKKLKC